MVPLTLSKSVSFFIYLKSTRLPDLHILYVNYCKSKVITFDSFPELKSKLLTSGYKPFIQGKHRKITNAYQLGSSYAFEYYINKKDDNIIIDSAELEL